MSNTLFFFAYLVYNTINERVIGMFIDEVKIEVTAGNGGDGCMAFRREKFVPMGGPFGGNGGRGGNIVLIADNGLKTLIDLKYKKKITGNKGENGLGKNQNGKNGEDIVIKVPVGTVIKDQDTSFIIADLNKHGQTAILASGGRGGRGNVALATKHNPCPSVRELGEPGEKRYLNVELKMLADVGLVGMPSVGKSTFLSMISNAHPEIAAYHFTTLSPNLGVVKTKVNDFVVADLPGLIEGAAEGAGLGIKFLKHIERTKVLVHIIDMSGSEGRDPYVDYLTINKELESYSDTLLSRPMIVVANKMDLETSHDNLVKFKKKVTDREIFEISAINNENINTVIERVSELVLSVKDTPLYDEDKIESHVLYKFKKEEPFTIAHEGNNLWVVRGDEVEKLLRMTNFNTEEAMMRFAKKLRKMGIDDKLVDLGVQEGDIVRILNYEFEYTK